MANRTKTVFNQYINDRSHIKVYIETIIGAIFGIILGFLVDLIFPTPSPDESIGKLFLLIFLQVLLDATIVFLVLLLSEKINIFDQEKREGLVGFLIFTVLFFLVQTQLLTRLRMLYQKLTGKKLPV